MAGHFKKGTHTLKKGYRYARGGKVVKAKTAKKATHRRRHHHR